MTAMLVEPLAGAVPSLLDFETCRYCQTILPWDEEIMCWSCRETHVRPGRRCSDCRAALNCDCCDYCDDCTPYCCEACGETYDRDEEGNDEYCGDCRRERYCGDCGEYTGLDGQYDGVCSDCAPHCEDCDSPRVEHDLENGLCSECVENRTCEACDRVVEEDDLILQQCSVCREVLEGEDGE